MNEVTRRNEYQTTTSLSKLGVSAVGFTAAGIFLLVLIAISNPFWLGLIIGIVVTLFGAGAFMSKDLTDKKAGIIILAAGILTILTKIPIGFLQKISGFLLGAGAIGLLALGIINAVRFFKGLKKRS